jgi:pSer/pThr/pTyr-binding forkhead associated (FHA) protein
MPSLRMTKGDSPGKEFALDREVTVIGKGPSCDIILANRHVSQTHARIERSPDGLYIEDLKSTNKTKVGGRVIERQRLEDGDLIKICGYQFEYVEDIERPGIDPTILSEIDATRAADGTATEVRSEEKLRAIMEIVTGLTGVLGLGSVPEKVLGALFRIFPQAERALLGVIEGETYRAETTTLGTGDVVVAYTDGVSDATSPDGGQFGTERLRQTLSVAPGGVGPVGEALREAVRRHAAGRAQFDDITLLTFGRP